MLLIVADQAAMAARVLGDLRLAVAVERAGGHGHVLGRGLPDVRLERGRGRCDPLHHPFTAPKGDLDADPGTWRSRAYDVVMNGWELGGGSIRINTPEVQQKVFDAIGIHAAEARERFGFLLEALEYGAPPHGGIAFGLDRIVGAASAGEDSIREVIPYPEDRERPGSADGSAGAGG